MALTIAVVFPLAAQAHQEPKPFTQEQVQGMVRDGLADESGAKLVEQRGIDFAPTEDFLQSLKAAGANEGFLAALRAARSPQPSRAPAKKPLNQVQVFALLAGQVSSARVAMLVKERGIDFEPTDDYLEELRLGGGEDELISALRNAKVTKAERVDPTLQARQVEIRQHVERATELDKQGQYAEAEQQYRAAILLDPHDETLYFGLSYTLGQQGKWDSGEAAAREALRLNPNDEDAHLILGAALANKKDWDGAITEEREALRLNPNNEWAHRNLGAALGNLRDWDGDMGEQREALRLNPSDEKAHLNLGVALANKWEWDEAIVEYREALRLNPTDQKAHVILAAALDNRGNWDGAVAEYSEAVRLNPRDDKAHAGLGMALWQKGQAKAAAAEEAEALRLNVNCAAAYRVLGMMAASNGHWGAAFAEENQALQLDPNDDLAHYELGVVLEKMRDPQGALQQYRAACELAPQVPEYRQAYQRLLKKAKP
jgi:tetratricopeptide (TPR) repeat protein